MWSAADLAGRAEVGLDQRQAVAEQGQNIDRHGVVGHLPQARGRDRNGLVAETVEGSLGQQKAGRPFEIADVAAGRLFEVAQVLSVPVNYFFDGLDQENERAITPRERMCLELSRNFAQIPNERHQEALSQLARALAADE